MVNVYTPGQIVTTSLAGTELVQVDNGGAVVVAASAQTIANLAASGGTTTTTLIGTEYMPVQTAGGTQEKITGNNFVIWAVASGTSTAAIVGTEIVPIQTAGGASEKATTAVLARFEPSHTTSAMTNSSSITLSSTFTALTFTQTSTGNTVHLKASPADGEKQGFSITDNVTNLTVSSAANTVKNGASTDTTSAGGSFWWMFNSGDTSWYRYSGNPLSK